MTYYINVNRQTIFKNAKHNTNEPPVSYQKGKHGKRTYCHELKFVDGQIIYHPHDHILKCGARLVITTEHEPRVIR